VTGLDEMASHRESHRTQPDETDVHLQPLSREPSRVSGADGTIALVSERVRNFTVGLLDAPARSARRT
jgi:hypothetical protein